MKIVFVSFSYDKDITASKDLLAKYHTSVNCAEALAQKAADIIFITRFCKDDFFKQNNVQYIFIKDRLPAVINSFTIACYFLKKLVALNADVIHIQGLGSALRVWLLRQMLPKKTVIIVQEHGGLTAARGIKSYLRMRLNAVADGLFFTTTEQAANVFHLKKYRAKLMPVMEGSNHFVYSERENARKKTGMQGRPVFLWVGRLDNNKDPLTVLQGFELLLRTYTTAVLYMIYSDDKLLADVQQKINTSNLLKTKVYLLGNITHAAMENYYNSADYFVLGSHYEGSGYALSEALACGCIPIVTNIPSFVMMTDNGRLGALWQTGNAQSFADAANIAMYKPIPVESKACTYFFAKTLSFAVIAETSMLHYQQAIQKRLKK